MAKCALRVYGSRFMQGLGLRVYGSRFRVYGSGFRVMFRVVEALGFLEH